MTDTLISIHELKKYWSSTVQLALDIPNLHIGAAEKIAILGPSGSGKTTFLKTISKDLKINEGCIYFLNQSLEDWSAVDLSHHRAVLPQSNEISFDLSVDLIVSLGRVSRSCQSETEYIVYQCLDLCKASHLLNRSYHQLSGGEKARVQMAKVFAQLWDVHGGALLVDEPFAALDPFLQIFLLKSLSQFVTLRSLTIIAILHDVNHAMQFFDRGLLIKDGKLFLDTPISEIQKKPLEDLYENSFLEFKTINTERYFIAK
jgi:iron complex transport system ATP-binding protein